MSYVDGVVMAVPTDRREAFIAHAESVAKLLKDNGALAVVDCWGDQVPDGELTSFPKAVACKPDETVVFSWIQWPSKEAREKAMETVVQDPLFKADAMPFDGKRLIFGGFDTIVHR